LERRVVVPKYLQVVQDIAICGLGWGLENRPHEALGRQESPHCG